MIIDKGKDNIIKLDPTSNIDSCTIEFIGSNNSIEIGKDCITRNLVIKFFGDNHKIILKDRVVLYGGAICFEDKDNLLSIDEGTLAFEYLNISVVEPGRKVIIGKKCLFSNTITFKTSDSHSILDKDSGKRLNFGKDIKIGDKVWIGEKVCILKGAIIGSNCVIGTRAVVTKGDYPDNSLLAGNPAEIKKSNIRWQADRIMEDK